jgi:hypothetical protein
MVKKLKTVLSLFNLLTFLTLLIFPFLVNAQTTDSIRQRVIFIGDAGEMDKQQGSVIANASSHIIPGKTTVIYLGDNIYKYGMALPGSDDVERTEQILRSQYQPMRSKGAPVYFVPGNHDWDKSGKNGLAKIRRQWQFLNDQNDPALQLVPPNGCPDPIEINIGDSLTIIAFDSEWWLYPFRKTNPGSDCDCNTKDEVVVRMEELFYKNRYKVIMLASHHPFQSYGVHGGYFSWKDHIFPLNVPFKGLYIPLPVVGSLYPILRKSFVSPEDLKHPLYKDMIQKIDKVFEGFPNLIHVAGHEHGLQFIKNEQVQIVSGSGAKKTSVAKRKPVKFANAIQGYVTVDQLTGNKTLITYYTYQNGIVDTAFTYTQPYQNVKALEQIARKAITDDSIDARAYGPYDSVSKLHKKLFGKNFRKEWSALTRMPVLKISELKGGLTPYKRGGGHQTYSLRLKDKDGNEWVLRSIEKYPDVLLPESLRGTFATDILKDVISAQHPYAVLAIPVLANAVNVPHTNPIIGYVAPDKRLGIYEKVFANTVCLFEEREPLGNSDNTAKMLEELNKDNDNSVDSSSFFRARLLDLFLGDWDRHEDQWRWYDSKKGSGKKYIAIPRDRDQAFYRNEGLFPSVASQKSIAPFLRGFRPKIKASNEFFINGKNLDNRFLNQLDRDQWMKQTNEFVAALTDSVLDASLKKLPQTSYQIRHDELFDKMKQRRGNIANASEKYFSFLNKIVDLELSDKNELVEISDAPDGAVSVIIHKISREGKVKDQLFSKVFARHDTKEIRIFAGKGDDSVVINTKQSPVKLRIVGGKGDKDYNVINARKKIQVYERESGASFEGMTGRIKKHLSNDSANLAILPTNRYNLTIPLLNVGFNPDDGILLGISFRHKHHGFRKLPLGSLQQLDLLHAFSSSAFRIDYTGQFLETIGKADFLLQATAKAPDNTQNFFGRGNENVLNKTGNYKKFYRARFAIYQAEPALRWRNGKSTAINIGPSFQFYHYDKAENVGRFISNSSLIGSYDSNIITKDKVHLGVGMNFISDKRNSSIFPTWGSYINVRIQGYAGMNDYSKTFFQIIPEISLYKSLNAKRSIVLAERVGGGVSFGKTTFYQSQFIGGNGNLLGYRQYRFAGQHSFYNNIELRIKLADFASYVLPGQFGFTGFFDVGRVWEKDDDSGKWHNGVGGGFYFAPAQLAVLQIVVGYSREGWYPAFSMGFRF